MQQYQGIIIKGIGGFYYVEAADVVFECKARGIFRKESIVPLVGDHVIFTVNAKGENTIDKIEQRKNSLIRPPIANIDQLFIVISTCSPVPSTLVIDKLTAIAYHKGIMPFILISKTDLKSGDFLKKIYSRTGFPVIIASGITGQGIKEIRNALSGKISAFTGNSGVGKSTILNALDENLKLSTGEISEKLGRGKHTTRHCELFHVANGYVADTPGFSSLDLERHRMIRKEELPFCFPEFKKYLGTCKFTSCSHINDKGCAIVKAVENGEIELSRYESYVNMYEEVKNFKEWDQK